MRNLKLHWRRLRDLKEIELHGVRVKCGKDDVPRSVRSALFKETYEAFECRMALSALRPGDRVLEIGCGIGLVSLLATRVVGEGNVLSCEANRSLEQLIISNYALNGWKPSLVMKPVTADGRDVVFHSNENLVTSSTFERNLPGVAERVEAIAIGDVIASQRPNVIIMDVEGAEVELLQEADLKVVELIIVEVHPHIVGEDTIQKLFEVLQVRGFKINEQEHKTYVLSRR